MNFIPPITIRTAALAVLRHGLRVAVLISLTGLARPGWAAPTLDFSYAPTPEERAYVTDSFGYPGEGREFGQSFLVSKSGRLTKFDFKILTTSSLPSSGNLVLGIYPYTLEEQSRPVVSTTAVATSTIPINTLPVNTWQYVQPDGFMAVPWTSIALPGAGLEVNAGTSYVVALNSDVSLSGGAVGIAGGEGPRQGTHFRVERDVTISAWTPLTHGWFVQSYVDDPTPQLPFSGSPLPAMPPYCDGFTHYISASGVEYVYFFNTQEDYQNNVDLGHAGALHVFANNNGPALWYYHVKKAYQLVSGNWQELSLSFWPNDSEHMLDRYKTLADQICSTTDLRAGFNQNFVGYFGFITNPAYAEVVMNANCISPAFLHDHFEFSQIFSPQSVGAPFPITITAKDKNRNPLTGINEVINLTSNGGEIYPTTLSMSNGKWEGEINIFEPGKCIQLNAKGSLAGKSNFFDVGAQNSGKISGYVKDRDNLETRLAGAKIYLRSTCDPTTKYEAISLPNGFFSFGYFINNIMSGNYDIWAEYNGKVSETIPMFIKDGMTIKQDILINLTTDIQRDPVILVPGFMGSSSTIGSFYPTLPKDPQDTKPSDIHLHDFASYVGWESLISDLRFEGYVKGDTIIECPYDWRRPLNEAVEDFLKLCISKAKAKTGKVNIVAHSAGGLLTRHFIQNNDDYKVINKFIMVGTPNKGSAKMYYIWEGGDPYTLDQISGGKFYSNTSERLYNKMKPNERISKNIPPDKFINFFNDDVKHAREFNFIDNFLIRNGVSDKITLGDNPNKTLIELNSNGNRFRMKNGQNSTINTAVFIGTSTNNANTLDKINVHSQKPQALLYQDGEPINIKGDPEFGDGDETVLKSSATFPYDNDFAGTICEKKGAIHSKLIGEYSDLIVKFLKGDALAGDICKSQTVKIAMANQTQDKPTLLNPVIDTIALTVLTSGRVQPLLIAPDNNSTGIVPLDGQLIENIPNSIVSTVKEETEIGIKNPSKGTYSLQIKGNYNEEYSLEIEYSDAYSSIVKRYYGFNHANTSSFNLILNADSYDKIEIDHSPLAPTGLKADPYDSGGLKTRISWDKAADPNVLSYNIYSKVIDEPHLSKIGTINTNIFETNDPWASDTTIRPKVYSVSAINISGKESFLSDSVLNNDRDHDGLTDAVETYLGLNDSNPDTDGDGLKDGKEYYLGTNPKLSDTDGDGYSDDQEVMAGSDPLDPNSTPKYFIYLPLILR